MKEEEGRRRKKEEEEGRGKEEERGKKKREKEEKKNFLGQQEEPRLKMAVPKVPWLRMVLGCGGGGQAHPVPKRRTTTEVQSSPA